MKLHLIAEIQRKSPTTNMDRSNATGVLGGSSMNDYFHMVHGGDGHAQTKKSKPKKKAKKNDK